MVCGILVAVAIVATIFLGVKLSKISDAIAANTTAVNALTVAVGNIDIATDADVAQVGTNTTAVDAAITALGGTPPA